MDRSGLVPAGHWFDTTPIFMGMEEEDTSLPLCRGESPGSQVVSTDTLQDDSLPDGRHEGSNSLLGLFLTSLTEQLVTASLR